MQQEEKLKQYNEFFTISHSFSINIETSPLSQSVSDEQFNAEIPLPFQMASDNIAIEQKALKPLQSLAGNARQLVDYLQHQANKIDLLVNYILSQHDDGDKRFTGIAFGGGGFSFQANDAFNIADKLIAKIFILDENCAVYCHGEIITKKKVDELDSIKTETTNDSHNDHYQYDVIFSKIREQDREVLVRTSLHLQAKQLQTLAKQRNQAAKSE